jgi:hypothetical protein
MQHGRESFVGLCAIALFSGLAWLVVPTQAIAAPAASEPRDGLTHSAPTRS